MKSESKHDTISKPYLLSVLATALIFPALALFIEFYVAGNDPGIDLFGKWLVFFTVGGRLFIAGIKQSTNPSFTAKTIFHLNSTESYPIIRELGFANICFGLLGIISIVKAEWRPASALVSGLYYGLAGLMHVVKKPAGRNEQFAMWTDLLLSGLLFIYFLAAL